MADIFISFKQPEDRKKIEPLVQALRDEGWSVWWCADLVPGDLWHRIVQTELDRAVCIMVVWSTRSLSSNNVLTEATVAWKRECLIQVTIEGVSHPTMFEGAQGADLTGWGGDIDEPRFQELCRGVRQLLLKRVKESQPAARQQSAQPALSKELVRAVEEGAGRAYFTFRIEKPSDAQIIRANYWRIQKTLQKICETADGGRVELDVVWGEFNPLWQTLVTLLKNPERHFPHNSWLKKNPGVVKDVINIGAPRMPRQSERDLAHCVVKYVRAWLEDPDLSRSSDGKFRHPRLDILLSPPKEVWIGDDEDEVEASRELKRCMTQLYIDFRARADIGKSDSYYICVLPLLNKRSNSAAGVLVEAVRNLHKADQNAKSIPVREWLIDESGDYVY